MLILVITQDNTTYIKQKEGYTHFWCSPNKVLEILMGNTA